MYVALERCRCSLGDALFSNSDAPLAAAAASGNAAAAASSRSGGAAASAGGSNAPLTALGAAGSLVDDARLPTALCLRYMRDTAEVGAAVQGA